MSVSLLDFRWAVKKVHRSAEGFVVLVLSLNKKIKDHKELTFWGDGDVRAVVGSG